ncbi:MAG: hypothetical protein HWQ41_19900 [Nostoc sp. NOS(2021)]|uniref:hypothetical protein n=1 Tax=Nostoc sp. NOS(2021) TaxID=2815407 RepID=UPI0025DDACEF|nr:hypothetical protein [Nostoc sp. NOS(2021)]MBN3897456.1 hypothetical protein [Nostoc sp. NOS(2021)]
MPKLPEWNGTLVKPKGLCRLVPSLKTGNVFKRGLLLLVKPLEAAALPAWVKSLEALNQSGQGLYLNLVPFLPECDCCLLYSHDPHVISTVHPDGVDGDT